jgi:hypothetical protein
MIDMLITILWFSSISIGAAMFILLLMHVVDRFIE